MFALVNKFMSIYYPIEPLDQQGSEIDEKHFLVKVHFAYSKFVPFSHEFKDLCSLNSVLAHFFNPRSQWDEKSRS